MYGAGSRYVERSAERAAIRGGGDGKVTFPPTSSSRYVPRYPGVATCVDREVLWTARGCFDCDLVPERGERAVEPVLPVEVLVGWAVGSAPTPKSPTLLLTTPSRGPL